MSKRAVLHFGWQCCGVSAVAGALFVVVSILGASEVIWAPLLGLSIAAIIVGFGVCVLLFTMPPDGSDG